MVTVACPNCAKRLKASDEAIGKKAKCTNCGRSFVLPPPPPSPSVEPAEIVLEPVDAPRATRLPGWSVVALCCGGGVLLLVLVALVFTRRNATALPPTSVAGPPLASAAEPSQKSAASAPSPALDAAAPGSLVTSSEASKTLEAELQQFAKMPADKALQVYFEALTQEVNMESERQPLRDKARQAYNKEWENAFTSRVPKDLEDALRRMREHSVRHKRVLEIAMMPGPERAAAVARDSAEEQRIWRLRKQFRDEVKQGKILGFVNFVRTNQESGQPLKTLETKLQELQTKIDKCEASLFPRLTREQLVEARNFVHVSMRADEDLLAELKKTLEQVASEADKKEVKSRTPPELEAALRRQNDLAVRLKRMAEIMELPSSRQQEAARKKDAEEDRRLHEISSVIDEESKWMGAPLAFVLYVNATDIQEKCDQQEKKCARLRARSQKLEESLNVALKTDSTSPAPAQGALEAELQQFAKLPVDRAMKAYWKGLIEAWDAESEYDRLRLQADQAFTRQCENEFKKRVPVDLADTFKRMTDRAARHARLLTIWKMQEPERAVAEAKDAAEEERVWKLRQQFDDEQEQGKVSELTNSKNETAQRLKAEDSKIQALRARAGKFEGNLFPRMSRDQVATMRQFVNPNTRLEEDKLAELKKALDATAKRSSLKEVESRMRPELEAAFRRASDPALMMNRADGDAAQRKQAEDDGKLRDLAIAIAKETKLHGPPMTMKADIDATDLPNRIAWQEEKCSNRRAISMKLEDVLNAKDGR